MTERHRRSALPLPSAPPPDNVKRVRLRPPKDAPPGNVRRANAPRHESDACIKEHLRTGKGNREHGHANTRVRSQHIRAEHRRRHGRNESAALQNASGDERLESWQGHSQSGSSRDTPSQATSSWRTRRHVFKRNGEPDASPEYRMSRPAYHSRTNDGILEPCERARVASLKHSLSSGSFSTPSGISQGTRSPLRSAISSEDELSSVSIHRGRRERGHHGEHMRRIKGRQRSLSFGACTSSDDESSNYSDSRVSSGLRQGRNCGTQGAVDQAVVERSFAQHGVRGVNVDRKSSAAQNCIQKAEGREAPPERRALRGRVAGKDATTSPSHNSDETDHGEDSSCVTEPDDDGSMSPEYHSSFVDPPVLTRKQESESHNRGTRRLQENGSLDMAVGRQHQQDLEAGDLALERGMSDLCRSLPCTSTTCQPSPLSTTNKGGSKGNTSAASCAWSKPASVGRSSGSNTNKPIRGLRSGEAIGLKSKVFDTTTIPTTAAELRNFVCVPFHEGPGTVVRCFIERNRSGTHKISCVFSMYADLEDGSGRLLLTARKLLASKTAYYIICTRQEDLYNKSGKRGGDSFLGKLRASSTSHSEYALYDGGENPDSTVGKSPSSHQSVNGTTTSLSGPLRLTPGGNGAQGSTGPVRKELMVVHYNFDKKVQRTGKRRMEVAIPKVGRGYNDEWEQVCWQPSNPKDGMKFSFGRIRYQGAQNLLHDDRLTVFHQRESRYDPLSSCLVDFRGRATAASVKNFQLIKSPPEDNLKRVRYFCEGEGKCQGGDSDDVPRPVVLQMGKVGRDCFNVDVEWPFSLLQAFAICLSRFDANTQF